MRPVRHACASRRDAGRAESRHRHDAPSRHDIDTHDEPRQADFTREFLTTVFSHPSVVAVLTWGFWEKSHWRPQSAYYRSDGSMPPAGQAWHDLVTKK